LNRACAIATGLLVLAILPLLGGLLVFLGGHESKTEFASSRKVS